MTVREILILADQAELKGNLKLAEHYADLAFQESKKNQQQFENVDTQDLVTEIWG